MPEAERLESIAALARDEWNRCCAGELEDYDYFVALERARIGGFTLCYYVLREGDTLLAGFPAFFTDYDLATTADGTVKTIITCIKKIAPKLFTLKLGCIGSFATETCTVALHPDATVIQKREWFSQLLSFFKEDAARSATKLLAFKDINTTNKTLFDDLLAAGKFHCVAGMPTAVSSITSGTIDDYLAQLSSATRKDMRRKLKKRNDIRIEYTQVIEPHLDTIYAMYLETKNRSDLQFEELTPGYFREVANHPQGLCSLYYKGEILIGCNVMLANKERLLDKFFCMRTQEGQTHNLYFISWFANVQYCLDHGLKIYQSGQAGYETKLRLGSKMEMNWMYFHHANAIVNRLLKLASPLLAFDIPVNS